MGKKHILAGREYETIGPGTRAHSDLNGRGVYIERTWGQAGALFSWNVNPEFWRRYATWQARSWEEAAQDAHEALAMMEQGLPAPPPKYRGRPSFKKTQDTQRGKSC